MHCEWLSRNIPRLRPYLISGSRKSMLLELVTSPASPRFQPFAVLDIGAMPVRCSAGQAFSFQPVLKIHPIAARQAPRKPRIATRLTPTGTSETAKKLQRNPLIR